MPKCTPRQSQQSNNDKYESDFFKNELNPTKTVEKYRKLCHSKASLKTVGATMIGHPVNRNTISPMKIQAESSKISKGVIERLDPKKLSSSETTTGTVTSGLSNNVTLQRGSRGNYEIKTDNGETILPSVWGDIVQPFSTIQISFLSTASSRQQRSNQSSNIGFEDTGVFDGESRRDDDVREVTFDIDVPKSSPSDSINSHSDEDKSEGSLSTPSSTESEDEDGLHIRIDRPEVTRDVISPIDAEGYKLSFSTDTSRPRRTMDPTDGLKNQKKTSKEFNAPHNSPETYVETLRITKALSAEVEGRNFIQVHTLPNSENSNVRERLKMSWYHIPASRLDFSRFKDVCQSIPSLSDRLQTLLEDIFKKVEKENVKSFLDGMFIDPGTVVRADESGRDDSESVIFSCVPYLELRPPAKKLSTGLGGRLFPYRTLMQSFYPYEPVQERDAEQAFRKFGNDKSGNVVSVPNLWVMNIGSDVVVTCGYEPLSQELAKSIEVIQEDLEQLGGKDITKNNLTNIRFTDRDGHVLLFSLDACRSYFQMEQKLRELKYGTRGSFPGRDLEMMWESSDGLKKVTPGTWGDIIRRTDLIFIEIATLDETQVEKPQKGPNAREFLRPLTPTSSSSVPPFFHWRYTAKVDIEQEENHNEDSTFCAFKRSMKCLDHAERGMLSETLEDYDTFNAVDKTFTSKVFYQSLSEGAQELIRAKFSSLKHQTIRAEGEASGHTHHEVVIDAQCARVAELSARFFEIVQSTVKLFVANLDQSTIVRKLWSAMANIYEAACTIEQRGAMEADANEYLDPYWKHPLMFERAWFVRSITKDEFIQTPVVDEKFKRVLKRCRRCQSNKAFDSPEGALGHLQKHMRQACQPGQNDLPTSLSSIQAPGQPSQLLCPEPNLRDWVVNCAQFKREEMNAGVLRILTQACEIANDLFFQTKELSEGVKNEDGRMSDMYMLPRHLVEAFREMIVFYLAIERSLYYTEESYNKNNSHMENHDMDSLPFSAQGLVVLQRFGEGARRSLAEARTELCGMVAPLTPINMLKHMSLGPEYQFQVNHRPGKRLLRSINLLQEELQVLSEVTTWQTKLIQNYLCVLDDKTYENDIPSRRALFPYERLLLQSCLENLQLTREEYAELLRRCGPLSESTKQSVEINEEDHGKAIMVFTVVTVIFLPLSFVTSYLGMNTVDIRDMSNRQSLFWIIALPLTLVTMGTCLLIGYNGDEIRDTISSLYRTATRKEGRGFSSRGISIAQRRRAQRLQDDPSSTLSNDYLADEAEYASPRPDQFADGPGRKTPLISYLQQPSDFSNPTYLEPETLQISLPGPRTKLQTHFHSETTSMAPVATSRFQPTYTRLSRRYLDAESLLFYDIPYEIDHTDTNFFLVKRDLTERESRVLFEHTKRFRESGGRHNKKTWEIYNENRYGQPGETGHRRAPMRGEFVGIVEDDKDDDVSRVEEYTWHRRRSHKYPRRGPRHMAARRT
ncbi:hypothetical protein BKA66DRAFT_553488 [Pyrenochaeta sp. MPI-SDFR-AT-0127]|nr:hypothetical protein BKA66DRAFT_553488 [Pyrenochaeta sp. MPI-SDFR-AT-0127]